MGDICHCVSAGDERKTFAADFTFKFKNVNVSEKICSKSSQYLGQTNLNHMSSEHIINF